MTYFRLKLWLSVFVILCIAFIIGKHEMDRRLNYDRVLATIVSVDIKCIILDSRPTAYGACTIENAGADRKITIGISYKPPTEKRERRGELSFTRSSDMVPKYTVGQPWEVLVNKAQPESLQLACEAVDCDL
jgi:hypothetical protein